MDLRFSDADLAFREKVRAFVRDNLSEELRQKVRQEARLSREETAHWNRILYERGWSAPKWPEAYGGTNWTPTQHYIFREEMSEAPPLSPFGIAMVGPLLYTYGTDEQKERYLPGILSGDEWWCQGYSEPGAGSDLASLQTRAELDDDAYIVNGQKIWTGYAHIADMIFCLVRTNSGGKKQEGISLLLINMNSPGVVVRPIYSIDGIHAFNEVFFENVRVPVDNLVGEQDKGWTYAKFILGHERTHISGLTVSKQRLRRLKDIAKAQYAGGRPIIEDGCFRDRLAQLEIDYLCLEHTSLRILSDEQHGKTAGPEASLMKVGTSTFSTKATEMILEALGYHGTIWEPQSVDEHQDFVSIPHAVGAMEAHIYARKYMILGGTNEIQKNIYAKAAMRL